MQSATQDFLNKFVPNEFRQIWNSGQSLDEKFTALYIRALQDDCFEHYKPRYSPPEPSGWFDDYNAYKSIKEPAPRSTAWRKIQEKYKGYLEAKNNVEYQNSSDFCFLKIMLKHFEGMSMLSYCAKISQRLREFEFVAGLK